MQTSKNQGLFGKGLQCNTDKYIDLWQDISGLKPCVDKNQDHTRVVSCHWDMTQNTCNVESSVKHYIKNSKTHITNLY